MARRFKDPIVIGGGITGSSIVYHLTLSGYNVQWFEGMYNNWFATRHSIGMCAHQSDPLKFNLTSQTLHDVRSMGEEFVQSKSIQFTLVDTFQKGKLHYPFDMKTLFPFETSQFDGLSSKYNCVTLNEHDGWVNPVQLSTLYKRSSHGKYTFHNKTVIGLMTDDNSVKGVVTHKGEFEGDVIDATGAWMGKLARKEGILPDYKNSLYNSYLDQYAVCSYPPMHNEGHGSVPFIILGEVEDKNGISVAFKDNEVYIHLHTQFSKRIDCHDFNPHLASKDYTQTLSSSDHLLSHMISPISDDDYYDSLYSWSAHNVLPDVNELKIKYVMSGLSTYTNDGYPIVGEIVDGLILAGGCS